MPPSLRHLSLLATAAALGGQAVYLFALRRGFQRAVDPPAAAAPAPPAEALPPISVVVAARNEAHRLPRLLGALARQTHPHFEVVVVDDASTDATAAVVAKQAARAPHVRLVRLPAAEHLGKKRALARGVAATRFPLLAFTDADCVPPPRWLETVARRHAAGRRPAVMVGYGPYGARSDARSGARSDARSDALSAFVRYETLTTAWLTAGAIGLGRPYMAVGRNLSYPKALFERVGGFAHSLQSVSGDDDLLVQEVDRRGLADVLYLADADAHVPSEPPPTWRAWLRQKRRHTSAGRFYRPSIQRHLALYHATSVLLWLAPFAAGRWGAAALAARLLLHRCALTAAADVLETRALLRAHPLLEGAYVLYNTMIAPLGLLRMPRRW